MSAWKSNKTAICVTAVAVVASTLLGSHRSLASLRGAVAKTLVDGADGSGYSVTTDGQTMVNVARNLVTVARKYLPGEEELYGDLESYCAQMEGAGTDVEAVKNARGGILSCCESLRMKLSATPGVSEKDLGYLSGFAVDLEAAAHSMAMDPYNKLAREFNENTLGRFPANLLGGLTGVRPLETFE